MEEMIIEYNGKVKTFNKRKIYELLEDYERVCEAIEHSVGYDMCDLFICEKCGRPINTEYKCYECSFMQYIGREIEITSYCKDCCECKNDNR